MKFAKVALIMAVDGRIHVNFGPPTQSARPAPVTANRELGGGKFTKELASESVTMSGEFDDEGGEYEEFDACCEMIESHVFGQKRAFKRMNQPGRRPVWVSNDDHQIQFNELLQMWQVVNSTTINPVGEAFSHGRNAADDCPTETEWTVRNLDSWLSVKNFVQCQGENDDDKQAFKLSYTVCDLIQETEGKNLGDRMRNSLQKRKNTLCNRAMNHARRVIRQRKCTKSIDAVHMARSMKTIYAVDTVKQWRDLLKNINEERNEHCNNRRTFQLLQDAIDRFHDSVTRLFSKQSW